MRREPVDISCVSVLLVVVVSRMPLPVVLGQNVVQGDCGVFRLEYFRTGSTGVDDPRCEHGGECVLRGGGERLHRHNKPSQCGDVPIHSQLSNGVPSSNCEKLFHRRCDRDAEIGLSGLKVFVLLVVSGVGPHHFQHRCHPRLVAGRGSGVFRRILRAVDMVLLFGGHGHASGDFHHGDGTEQELPVGGECRDWLEFFVFLAFLETWLFPGSDFLCEDSPRITHVVRENVLRPKAGGILHPIFCPFCAFAGVGSRRMRLIAASWPAWFCGHLGGKNTCDRGDGDGVGSGHLACRFVENGTAIVTNVMSYQIKKMIR